MQKVRKFHYCTLNASEFFSNTLKEPKNDSFLLNSSSADVSHAFRLFNSDWKYNKLNRFDKAKHRHKNLYKILYSSQKNFS